MRLLIIEDEKRTATHLQKGLSEHGFTVDVADDGFEGLGLARTGAYALIVLDVMLPRLDGWAILDELRRAGVLTAVLFLTAGHCQINHGFAWGLGKCGDRSEIGLILQA